MINQGKAVLWLGHELFSKCQRVAPRIEVVNSLKLGAQCKVIKSLGLLLISRFLIGLAQLSFVIGMGFARGGCDSEVTPVPQLLLHGTWSLSNSLPCDIAKVDLIQFLLSFWLKFDLVSNIFLRLHKFLTFSYFWKPNCGILSEPKNIRIIKFYVL